MSKLSGEAIEDELEEAIRKRAKDLLSHPKADSTKVDGLEFRVDRIRT